MIAAFSGNAYTLAAAPLLSWWIIAALAGAAALVLALGLWRRAGGVWWRGAAVLMLLAILVNPSLVEEKRSPLRDIAVVVVDESPSQQIGKRTEATNQLLEIVRRDRKWNDDGARKQLVQFFEAWGGADEATVEGRKRLSTILFS